MHKLNPAYKLLTLIIASLLLSLTYNITVNFPGTKDLIGQIVRVRITSAGESTLRGELV